MRIAALEGADPAQRARASAVTVSYSVAS
jgi:hypothetical protein